MKIAMFSRWNAADGVSVHAEFVGREWVKKGHSPQKVAQEFINLFSQLP